MRPWYDDFGFTAILAFITLHACSNDAASGNLPHVSAPGDARSGDGTTNAGDGHAPPDAALPSAKMNTTTEAIDVDGQSRRYVLSVPKAYDPSRPYPLIVALHGDGLDAARFVSVSKLEASTGDEAILAYPDQSVDLFTPYGQNTDQKLIESIVVSLKQRFSIDASKIWGFGYSKGAFQLNEIACKRPGLLTAMAIHAGGAPQTRDPNNDSIVDCPNAIGLATFVTHGEKDDPGGGEFGAAYWASRAGCQTTRSPSSPPMCEAYDGCDAAKPVVFCVVPNQPHYPLYPEAAAHSWAWFKTL